jgi:hypothetical protein
MRLIEESSECNFLESLQGPYNETPSTKAVSAGLFHQPTNVITVSGLLTARL